MSYIQAECVWICLYKKTCTKSCAHVQLVWSCGIPPFRNVPAEDFDLFPWPKEKLASDIFHINCIKMLVPISIFREAMKQFAYSPEVDFYFQKDIIFSDTYHSYYTVDKEQPNNLINLFFE